MWQTRVFAPGGPVGAGGGSPRRRRGVAAPCRASSRRGGGEATAMAARSIWNGTIAFGLMSVPVKLHTATESKTVHFREVHLDDGAKIEHRRFCSKEDKEVPYKQVVKGYEVDPDEYVVLDKDEISAAAGDGAHRID